MTDNAADGEHAVAIDSLTHQVLFCTSCADENSEETAYISIRQK